jgi:hypothetical protein
MLSQCITPTGVNLAKNIMAFWPHFRKVGKMKLRYRQNAILSSGYFEPEDGTIHVSDGLPPLIAECVYLHELQHKRCYDVGCTCFDADRPDDYLAEYHAFKGELIAVLERDSVALAQAYLKSVAMTKEKIAGNPRVWRSHKRALVRIERLRAYVLVQNLARGQHYYPGE